MRSSTVHLPNRQVAEPRSAFRFGKPDPCAVLVQIKAPEMRISPQRVTKIAIDIRAREGENKGHEESLVGVLPASGRLHGEEAAGCSDSASNTEPVATAYCRTHRTLCSRKTGKCQHSDLQLSACDHRDRFKNGAHQASLQENERGKMRLGLEGASLHHWAQAAPS